MYVKLSCVTKHFKMGECNNDIDCYTWKGRVVVTFQLRLLAALNKLIPSPIAQKNEKPS